MAESLGDVLKLLMQSAGNDVLKAGRGAMDAVAAPSRLLDAHMREYQPGMSVADMPETMDQLPGVAAGVTAIPGAPAGSFGSIMSRNGMIENQALLRRKALERRNAGDGGSTVRVVSPAEMDRLQGAPKKGTREYYEQNAKKFLKEFRGDKADAPNAAQYRSSPATQEGRPESLKELFERYADPANSDLFF